jgi:negative regulator of flagellin synthesis FlgM
MKIPNGIEDISQIFSSQAVTNAAAAKGSSAPQNETMETDKAQLSDLATQLAQSTAAPDVRMDKVASIQNALQTGTYQVSAEDVAQKVITSMLGPEK